MKEYLIGANTSILVLLIALNIVLTAGMFYLFYRILRSKSNMNGDYPMP